MAWLVAAVLPAHAQQAIGEARIYATERIVIGGTTFGTTSPLQVVGLPNLAGTIATVDGSGNIGLAATGTATISAILSATGAVTLGDATSDDITITGRLASGLTWKTDNTHDIGASGANRARDLFLGRNAAIGGTLGVTGASTLAALSATTGTFSGDVAVNGNDLTSTGVLNVRPTGNLTLDPTGDIVLGPDGLDILPDAGYSKNLGALTNKFLTLHAAELWVETLVAQNTIATIGGRILVGPTTTLTSDLAAAATSMSVKHNSLANGDRVYLEANGAVEFIAVASAPSGAGPYTYTITRNLDASGANDWTAGDAVFNTGTTGSGWIDLYSIRGVKAGTEEGPTICGNVRLSATYNDWEPRWCIGNLNGVYGYGADTYGTAFGDDDTANIVIDETNGIRIRQGTTTKFSADTSGNLNLTGDLVMGTAGVIRSGATALDTTTGYWLAHNAGTPQFRIGTMSGSTLTKGIRWDGTTLTVKSDYATLDSTGVGVPLAAAGAFATTNGYRFTGSALAGNAPGLFGYETGTGRVVGLNNETSGTGDTGIQLNTNRSGGSASLSLSASASLGYTASLSAGTSVIVLGGALGGAGTFFELSDNRSRMGRSVGGNYSLWIDTQNRYVGINRSTAPNYPLDVVGDVQVSTGNLMVSNSAGGAGTATSGAWFGGVGVAHGNLAWQANELLFVFRSGNTPTATADVYGAVNLDTNGYFDAGAGFKVNGTTGITFTANPTTCSSITVTGGIITAKAGC